jgi:xanthosine utilization system XapX-like protein
MFAGSFLYSAGLACAKDSILLLCLRFFQNKSYRLVAYVLIGLVTTFAVISWITTLLACQPLAAFWDRTVIHGHCFNIMAFWIAGAGFGIATDIAVCILPLPTFRKLQLPKRQKYGLIGVFVLGGL